MNTVEPHKLYDTDVTYVKCSGTNYEIGLTHGKLALEEIKRNIELYNVVYQQMAKIDWPMAKQLAVQFLPNIESVWPEIIEEFKGIAEGAQVEFEDILALNVRSEIALTNYSDGCTSIATENKDTGDLYVSQTWDWVSDVSPNVIILDVAQVGKPRFIAATEAGIVAKHGFNNAGVAVCLNALKTNVLDKTKLPIHLVLRKLLESFDLLEFTAKLEKFGIASAANLMCGDKTGAYYTIEATPLGFVKVYPKPGENYVTHTNHLVAEKRFLKDHPNDNSFSRYARINELTLNLKEQPNLDNLIERLSDEQNYPYSICRGKLENAYGLDDMITVDAIFTNVMKQEAEFIWGRTVTGKRYKLFFD